MADEFVWVADRTALVEGVARWCRAPFVALDTEFVRERTYYPRLCLLQVADGRAVYLLDVLAIEDLSPLRSLFEAPVPKVLHAARQDLEVFWWQLRCLPRPLFDTQVAAAYLGLGEQLGYGALVEQRLGLALPKGETRSDWARRPLSRRQLQYAAADVSHLAALYPGMREALARSGRLAWVEEDCERLLDPLLWVVEPRSAWSKVKGWRHLRGEALAVLAAVAAWRESVAQREDVPRRRVAADEWLLELARARPRDVSALARLPGARADWVRRHGEAVVRAVAEGLALPRSAWPGRGEGRLSPEELRRVEVLAEALGALAGRLGIAPGLLASRRELQRLVRGDRGVALLAGWRGARVAEAVVAFLEQGGGLVVQGEGLVWRACV